MNSLLSTSMISSSPPPLYEYISASEYGVTSRALLELTQKLRAIGAQTDVDLPRIVVIGNQSAGKSSVVESISGISVPRDSSTCTRCPMECRLSYSETWSAQVHIRWEYDRKGKPESKVNELPFGSKVTDKANLELLLRQAQLKVLSEHVQESEALKMTPLDIRKLIDGNKTMKFSRNVVCVDVHGPELTELAFIDLPGIIQNAEDAQVKLVEDMVVSHIQGHSLILVALPMTDDLENQKAMRLARLADPNGDRTIGVLTKPDLLSAGTKSKHVWLEILEGRRSPLLHGYYCTRHLDDAERETPLDATRARELEKQFFEKEAPWSESHYRERFGTPSLISNLSRLLITVIEASLPRINAEINKALSQCTESLSQMPKALDREPSLVMLQLISQLHSTFQKHADGAQGRERLVQSHRVTFSKFKKSIRGTVPNFWPFVKKDAPQEFINSLEDGSDEGPVDGAISTKQPFYLDDMRNHLEKALTRELPGHIPYPAVQSLIQAFQKEWRPIAQECMLDIKRQTAKILESCVKDHFSRWPTLLAAVRHQIHKLVDQKFDDCWMFIDCLLENEQTPYTQNDHYRAETQQKWLAKYKEANAGKMTSDEGPTLKRQKLDTAGSNQQKNAFTPSTSKPSPFSFTVTGAPPIPNQSIFGQTPSLFASGGEPPVQAQGFGSTSMRFDSALNQTDPELRKEVLANLVKAGVPNPKWEDIGLLFPPPPYKRELEVMAEVRSYFQVAYKRVIDCCPMTIDNKFLRSLSKDIQERLVVELGLGGSDSSARCARYLAEEPHITRRRKELQDRKEHLEQVRAELDNFGL